MVWAEIKNDFEDEDIIFIDAWETNSGSEVGTVIAKVYSVSGEAHVQYLDERARTDVYAQEIIQESVRQITNQEAV